MSTRRSLAILDIDPWGLVVSEIVGLVIGPRLPASVSFLTLLRLTHSGLVP